MNHKSHKIFIFMKYLVSIMSKYMNKVVFNQYKNNFVFYLRDCAELKKLLFFFKKHTKNQFVVLSDIFAVDFLCEEKRFEINYCLLSLRYNSRIRLNISVNETDKVVSVNEIFKCSSWVEREIWDLFGIFFQGNFDLRRILTDYGFEGYPLRKDFPLSGFIELRYDDGLKRIVYEPIEISQEFRFFDFKSPWGQVSI